MMIYLFASVTIALLVSALCNLLEATLLSLTPHQVAALSQRRPKLGAIWQDFKTRIERPIAVILLLNTASHTIGATVAGSQFEAIFGGGHGILAFSLLFTLVMLLFTEIVPKTMGVRLNGVLAPYIALPLAFVVRLMAPILFLVHLINKPFEPKRDSKSQPSTMEQITVLAGLARLANLINPHQERIIQGAFRLSQQRVRDVMIPAEQITFLSTGQKLYDAIITAHLDPHTRFPICDNGNCNRVLGYVNFKEMIYHARTNPSDHSLMGIIRPVHFVDPDQTASELLRVFVERHEHMAIVRDAQGKSLGLITLEDIVEELVGELEDEFDRLPNWLHPLSGGTWMVGGGVPVAELAKRIEVPLPDAQGTISAWLVRRVGRLPATNEVHQAEGARFMVRRIRRGKIFEVMVTRKEKGGADDARIGNEARNG